MNLGSHLRGILARRVRAKGIRVGFVIFSAIGLAACSASASPTPPSPSTTAGPVVSSAPSAARPAATGPASTTSQTDTDWGRIWDTLPSGFPTIAGSTPADEASVGPASAILVVDGGAAKTTATSLQTKLEAAGYTTTALGGPLEDGTYTLDMTGPPTGCMLQVTATPTGGLTTIAIQYGAACPHD
jgi:hypothetical protein